MIVLTNSCTRYWNAVRDLTEGGGDLLLPETAAEW